ARLVFLKIQSASICGQPALDGDLVGAVDWVVTNRDVYDISAISMSLGGGAFSNVSSCEASSTALTNALNAAEAAGIVNFAASGNDGLCSQMGRPACIDSVISVGAVYDADVGNSGFCVSGSACVSSLQTYPTCSTGYAAFEGSTFADKVTLYSNSTSFLDILAPSNCALSSDTGSGTNTCFGGTSAATPFAAGVGALAFEAAGGSRSLSRSAMENALKNNGVSVLDARMNRTTPRVDALATVQALNTGPAEICTNGVDDDGDGDTDCADSDCAGNAACQAPVLASYDFESGAQGWSNPDGNYGWRRDSNGTPSSSTGPTTGNGSTWYWYMETSNGQGPYNTGNADSTVVSPSIPNGTNRSLEFYYHMFGGDIGVLNAEVSTNGGSSWTTVWSIQGQQQSSQGAAYRRATADLSSFSGALLVRFRGEAVEPSVGWQNDIAIDDVTVYGNASNPGTPTELASYNFSSGTQGWSNPDGNYGWRRRSGSTPSNNTGPDNGQGNGGSYFYMETSNNQGPYDSGDPDAFLVSPTLPNGSNRSVEFYYHMYGSTMGRLNLEVSTNGGSSWTNVWSIQGQQHSSTSASYSTETVDLSGFSGSLRIRFRGESTAGSNGWRSDMAVDSITLFGN
ncbi:MAG: choice-of-anchor J domain-containing protein, partial [Myxococcota bacterium]